jgi:hypothetical protein
MATTSAAVLLLEIAYTRVLSVVLWYHMAFLTISLVLLGLGAPGVWLSIRPARGRSVSRPLVVAAVLVPLSVIAIFKLGTVGTTWTLVLCIVALLLPFLALGTAVCLLLTAPETENVGRMYGADLVGAAVGAMLVVPLLYLAPTPLLIAGVGLLPLAAALLLDDGFPRKAIAVVAVAIVALMVWGEPFRLRYTKLYDERHLQGSPIFEKWTPMARLVVFDQIPWRRESIGFLWGGGDVLEGDQVKSYWLEQDGSAGTPINAYHGNLRELDFLFRDVTTIGYQIFTVRSAAIIGAGGGRDVLSALRGGATSVDAVEINPATVAALEGPFRQFSGDVYHLPGVTRVVSEGRSFLTSVDKRYDSIQISLIDSFAATAAGAFSLSENNLYTVEAYQLYWRHLSPRGIVSTTRWLRADHIETSRLALVILEALRREGVDKPADHLIIVRGTGAATVIASKESVTSPELRKRIRDVCAKQYLEQLYPVPEGADPSFAALSVLAGPGLFEQRGWDIRPTVDDRPFFFETWPVFRLGSPNTAVKTLQFVILTVSGLTLLLFLAPFAMMRRPGARPPEFWRGSLFFSMIGLAFMFVEMPWIQRFILFLGHPSYATTVVLASLLVGAGLGATVHGRLSAGRSELARGLTPFVLVGLNLCMTPLFGALLSTPIWARVAVSVVFLVPAGALLGMWFPHGARRFGGASLPWFWALNGAASVLATVFTLALSMTFGFIAVAMMGAGFYVVAWLSGRGAGGDGAAGAAVAAR